MHADTAAPRTSGSPRPPAQSLQAKLVNRCRADSTPETSFCQAQEPHRNLANKSDGKAITDTYHNTSSNPRLPAKSNLTKLDTECKADSAPGTSVN